MQALLSNTASGKIFRNRPSTASSTHSSHHRLTTPEILPHVGHLSKQNADIAEGPGLAHDAGNLLGALGLYCELLALPGVLRDEHRHYADELQFLSGRSRDLIDRLLNPTATAGRPRITGTQTLATSDETHHVIIPDVIEGCRGLLNAVALRAVAVAYGAGSALPVSVSREALERILVNLTKNAAEAMSPGSQGTITLRVVSEAVEGDSRRIVLTVEDKGCGMSSAAVRVMMAPKVWTAARVGSRGLGFQVVRELVGASGGQLRLKSESEGNDRGTTVEVTWIVSAMVKGRVTDPVEQKPILRSALPQAQTNNRTGRTSC